MRIGVPRETKNHEYRVGLTPASVAELVSRGHTVVIEQDAGSAIGFGDNDYRKAGAQIGDVATAFAQDLIVKVKEPQLFECQRFKAHQTLITYLHLAADLRLTEALLASRVTAIAYETVTDGSGNLPLLIPMSEVAGRMSIQVGAVALQMEGGGRGQLLGGVPGVEPGRVVIIGGGTAGTNALEMAIGLQADVTIMDKSMTRLRSLANRYGSRIKTSMASQAMIQTAVRHADLVIGAVLVPGAAAPKLVSAELVRQMRKGSVLVDISIDQGGCFETSRPTSHDAPTYLLDGVVHYCVTNMPGAVARTATLALNNVTLPYIIKLADNGVAATLESDSGFAAGLNVQAGRVCHPALAESLQSLRPSNPRAA